MWSCPCQTDSKLMLDPGIEDCLPIKSFISFQRTHVCLHSFSVTQILFLCWLFCEHINFCDNAFRINCPFRHSNAHLELLLCSLKSQIANPESQKKGCSKGCFHQLTPIPMKVISECIFYNLKATWVWNTHHLSCVDVTSSFSKNNSFLIYCNTVTDEIFLIPSQFKTTYEVDSVRTFCCSCLKPIIIKIIAGIRLAFWPVPLNILETLS